MRLILLPGMDGTGLLFNPLQKELGDVPHTVLSYPLSEKLDYDDATEHIRKRLPVDEGFVLLAESYSGRVAYNLARQDIPNIKGVIFVVSFLSSPRPVLLSVAKLLPLSLLIRLPFPNWLFRKFVVGPDGTDDAIAFTRQVLKKVKPAVLAKRLRDIGNQTLPAETIAVDSYYIQAMQDRLVPSRCHQEMQGLIPNIDKTELAGPHLLLETNPVESADAIKKILANIS